MNFASKITPRRLLIIVVIFIAISLILNVAKDSIVQGDEYIAPSPDKISYRDVKDYVSRVNFDSLTKEDIFKGDLINKHTLKFFKFLQSKFKDMSLEEHFEAVQRYLESMMDINDVIKLMDLYKKFIEYENLAADEINRAGELTSPEDYLAMLRKLKKMQIEIFGQKDAELLFGAMMKMQEYPVRRSAIINDPNIYGAEKEKLLKKLNEDMWGNDAAEVERSRKPYVAYTETLSIYEKDLSEMSEEMKAKKVDEIRKSIFPPDVVNRLEEVDRELEAEKKRDDDYKAELSKIESNDKLSAQEKEKSIKELQDRIYGEDAEAVRRRENISKATEEMLKNYNLK